MGSSNEFHVLVGTDGSTQARGALAVAMQFPWPAGTRVRTVVARRMGQEHQRSILLAALDRGADSIASSAQKRLRRRWPDAEAVVVDKGPVAGVLSEAERFGADVIVLGWRGHGPIRRALMGSVSRGVVRGARCSVLVVRRRPADVRRILIGIDGSPGAQVAVSFAERLEAPRGGSVILFTAVEQTARPVQALSTSAIRATVAREVKRQNAASVTAAKRRLGPIAATLQQRGWRVRTMVSYRDPATRPSCYGREGQIGRSDRGRAWGRQRPSPVAWKRGTGCPERLLRARARRPMSPRVGSSPAGKDHRPRSISSPRTCHELRKRDLVERATGIELD